MDVSRAETRSAIGIGFLGCVLLWQGLAHVSLRAVDAVVYASVGKDIAFRPLTDWVVLTWVDGAPFFEHPPLMPWLIALSVRAFGATTTAAVLPAVVLSTLTIPLVYLLGRTLWNPRFGLAAMAILVLTPEFIRAGRQPMLEPALMFFMYLSLWLSLTFLARPRHHLSLLAGLAFGLAILAKGVPALATPVVVILFFALQRARRWDDRLVAGAGPVARHLAIVCATALVLVGSVELWYRAATPGSLVAAYLSQQVLPSYAVRRGDGPDTDSLFYVRHLLRQHWPWLPFVALGLVAGWTAKEARARSAAAFGVLAVGIIVGGFSLAARKNGWYMNVTLVGLALLAAVGVAPLVARLRLDRVPALSVAAGVLVLCVSWFFPSVLETPRPVERFFEAAGPALQGSLRGLRVADCSGWDDPWKAPFFVSFYLDAEHVDCDAESHVEWVRQEDLTGGAAVRFAQHPFALVERRPGHR